eukprot:Clim_evm17s88 gene=Clim_evmTU17s88
MQIFIRSENNKAVEVVEESLVSSLPIDHESMYVVSNGRVLEGEQTVGECVEEGATLDVMMRLRGGKVHGSLARAGKVKGQTPKVDKMEDKKKKKTGRAKRREAYNRRFVNVVLVGGKRRGPNAQ